MFAWTVKTSCEKKRNYNQKKSFSSKGAAQINGPLRKIDKFCVPQKMSDNTDKGKPQRKMQGALNESNEEQSGKERRDSGYRLRNHSYQQSLNNQEDLGSQKSNTEIIPEEESDIDTSPGPNSSQKKSKESTGVEVEDLDEMGSIDNLLPPKFLLKKEDFEKKNTANKLQAIMDAVNNIYTHHAQSEMKIKSLEFAVFDEESGVLPQMQNVAECMKGSESRVDLLTKEVIALREELDIAKGIIHKQSNQIAVLQNRQVDMTARSMAQNIVISGIKGDAPDGDAKTDLLCFLDDELEVEPSENEAIQVVHRLGQFVRGSHRPIVFRCPDSLRKRIFENTYKLAGKSFSVNRQLPEALSENKREIRQLIKSQNKLEEHLSEENKSRIQVINNKLYINGQLKRKRLLPPKPEDLFPGVDELEKMNSIKFCEATKNPIKGSEFKAMACVVNKMNDVHLAYKKVYRDYPSADHVAAAYYTEGEGGYQDDSEFGSGYRLLNVIKDHKLGDVAVFLIRFYGGEHLGPQRFSVMKELASEALGKLS